MKNFRLGLILAAATFPAMAQVWDNTGNHLLNGTYYFREVTLTSSDAFAIYGTITFTNGTYSINAAGLQASQGTGAGPYTTNGTYSIAASGFGFINNPLIGSPVYGAVGANGVFIGSITETSVSDVFIAAPLASQNAGTLNGPYTISYLQPSIESGSTPYGAMLQLNSNGSGNIGNVDVTAYADTTSATTQTITGVNYLVSNNAFNVTFPTNNTGLVQGQEFFYSTPDGSFIFGGSPEDFDMLVGVRTGSSPPFGGLYYQAGFQFDESQFDSQGTIGFNTYYGSLNANGGVILGHQRIQDTSDPAYGFTYSDSYPTGSGGNYTSTYLSTQYVEGTGGVQIGVGLGPLPALAVAIPAPSFTGSGVYLSPTGVVNTASYSPFTAGVSPGDFVILYGSNLGPSTLDGATSLPLPTKLDNVQVMVNNIPAPISYVRSDQVAVIVPFGVTSTVAQFQVINNGQSSNVITEFVNLTTPGVFTQDESGSGYAAALHANGSPVTPDSPAQEGETVEVFMSGLGTVFPAVLDGVGAPSSPPSTTSNTISAAISGTAATVAFQGLAPGFAGLYQVNIQIPTGLTAGDNSVDVSGPDSFASEAFISVGAAASTVPAARIHKPVHKRSGMRKLPLVKLPSRATTTP
ncbi:MAG: hypothetical protein ABSE86_08030 [Bryobacteraceae bacterium]|jgi:uncharacterized protein (TIGR03437 family)